MTNEQVNRINEAMRAKREHFSSDAKFSQFLGINPAIYSQLKNGKLEGVVSESTLISIARRLEVQLRMEIEWKTARTATFEFIYGQLATCQSESVSAIMCDLADIGKTYTAKYYTKHNKAVVYVDCSQVKTKQKLIRCIAKGFGVGSTGKYSDVYDDLVFYIRSISCPLIILDEAGDLDYGAFLELKALWNATERCCGWYMMGADGLQAKIDRSIGCKKVGYTEIFSRYGKKYQNITSNPELQMTTEELIMEQIADVIKANAPAGTSIREMIAKAGGSLRRVYTEICKVNEKERGQKGA